MSQHTKPCRECPFRRKGLPGFLGGAPAEVFIGQAHGDFWLPCHLHSDYKDPDWKTDHSKPQCAGTAIYRANVCKSQKNESLLSLPPDRAQVFSEPAEFIAYHKRITLAAARKQLSEQTVTELMLIEMNKPGVVKTLIERTT